VVHLRRDDLVALVEVPAEAVRDEVDALGVFLVKTISSRPSAPRKSATRSCARS
jgi:hypothetical protein